MNKFIKIENLPLIFRFGELLDVSSGTLSGRMLSYGIRKLLAEKKLFRISKGTYSKTANVFYIAQYIYKGYIGLSSALYLYGLKTEVESSVYVCTSRPMKSIRVLDKILIPVNVSDMQFGTTFATVEGEEVLLSSYAKTVFDIITNPRHADYFDMYRAINTKPLSKEDWREMLSYALNTKLANVRRVGYVLEGFAPAWFLSRLLHISNKSNGISYFFKHKSLNYSSSWKIYDSIGVRRWVNAR
ncbi:MAG: hypothetical protein M1122_00630 [Candidatus Marsarchaeota archaeon]|nr:hypothetical protein [Candidatus Marsarchaeota archaeon]